MKNNWLEKLNYIYIYKLKILPIYLRRKKLKKLKLYNYKKPYKIDFNEEICSFGELNPDKTFYVIRRKPQGAGLFSNFILALQHTYIAKERNLIPVVDYETYPSFYQEDHAIHGTRNVWEYYFEKISPYTLKEVYNSKNVILSNSIPPAPSHWWTLDIFNEPHFSHALETMKLIKFNKITQNYLEQKYNEIIPKNKKILGIQIRGTDYNKINALGHPIQPEINDFLPFCNEKFIAYQYDYVFLVTEDADKLDKAKNVFKDKLLYIEKERVKDFTVEKGCQALIPVSTKTNKNAKYLVNLNYLCEIYILSKCDSLISGLTGGVIGACLMNKGKYEHRITIMEGRYQ